MAITNSTNRINLVGDGVTVSFSYNFLVFDAADLLVFVDGVQKAIVADYTIPAAGINNPAGGNVVFVVAPPNLKSVVLLRVVVATQPVVYPVGSKFPSATHERVVDRLTMLVQQIIETLNRTFKLAATSLQTGTAVSDLVALKHVRVNAAATGLDMVDAPTGTVSFPITTAQGGLGADVSGGAAEGDLLVRDAGLVFARLAKGATSAILQAGATTLSWVTDLALASAAFLGWSDAKLFRGGANIIEQRNGVNAQTHRVFNTDAGGGNTEFAALSWAGNIFQIFTDKAGTGLHRTLQIMTKGASDLILGAFNTQFWKVDNANGNWTPLNNARLATSGLLRSVQTFAGSGTWTRPAGIRRVLVAVVGAGGGGGGANVDNDVGCGGGGGGCATKLLDVSAISTSTITIGAAGAAGAAAGGAGGNGGNSSWADGTNTVTGNGGAGGPGGGTDDGFGIGGSATGGDVNMSGRDGNRGGATSGNTLRDGIGGHAAGGFGAGGIAAPSNGDGPDGKAFGGGGSGGLRNVTTNRSGGSGAAGIITVYEYE